MSTSLSSELTRAASLASSAVPPFDDVMDIIARLRIERRRLQGFERLRGIEIGADVGVGSFGET